MVIKSVGVVSVGKLLACLYALLGLFVGAIFTLISLAGVAMAEKADAGPAALLIGAGSIILFPIFYGLAGFIGGIIMAALYNLVAYVAGGIEIELTGMPGDHTA